MMENHDGKHDVHGFVLTGDVIGRSDFESNRGDWAIDLDTTMRDSDQVRRNIDRMDTRASVREQDRILARAAAILQHIFSMYVTKQVKCIFQGERRVRGGER